MRSAKEKWTIRKSNESPGWKWKGLTTKILNHFVPGSTKETVTIVTLPAGRQLPYIRHKNTFEWSIVIDGDLEAILDGKCVKLKKNDFLFLPPMVRHSFKAGPRGVTAISVYRPPLKWDHVDVDFEGKSGPVSLKIKGGK